METIKTECVMCECYTSEPNPHPSGGFMCPKCKVAYEEWKRDQYKPKRRQRNR